MKNRHVRHLCYSLFLIAMTGQLPVRTTDAVEPPVLTRDDSAVLLEPGQTCLIRLEGNPTTGYRWELSSFDPSVVRLSGEPDYEPASQRIGAGGSFTFKLEALAAGTSETTFVYRRPWEQDIDPIEIFTIAIKCREPLSEAPHSSGKPSP